MASASEIAREIARVEALIESPEGNGKRTVLKAYIRKLYRQYLKALASSPAMAA